MDVVFLHKHEPVEVIIEKDIDEPLGLDFEEELFDGIRTCDNCCVFCFVHQLPQGLRKSLYVRDDDYRLSFLHGNFVTLTAASEDDIQKIITQRLSPMYVSVHTTNEALRRELLCSPDAPEIMPQLQALSEGGITLHTQIVLCPGRNDGEEMERTIDDLASLCPAVQSIAVVPVGLTRYRKRKELPAVDSALASKMLTQVRRRQRRFLKTIGKRLVYGSDEIYLTAGARIPKAAGYEGFPQLENGVGLVRKFLDNAAQVMSRFPERINGRVSGTVITGASAAPILQQFVDKLNRRTAGLDLKVQVVHNDLFGHSVTVTGLLAGRDVAKQLKGRDLGDVAFLPSVCLRDGLFLDDLSVESLEKEIDVPVRVVDPQPSALAAAILELVDNGTEKAA